MIRVGVVGVGAMGRHHARIYEQLEGCVLAGVFDIDEARGREVARAHGTRASETLEELLDDVDAVSVAVPTPDHHKVGVRCLRRGRHVLMEKPMAASLEEARGLVEAARQAGLVLLVGHVERYNPAVEALRSRVSRPGFIEVDRLGSFAPRSLETDVILDLMIHDIDVVLDLVGAPIREIRAVGVPVLSEAIDIANARLEFDGGCIANLTASRVSANRVRKVRIFQPEGYLSVDYTAQAVEHYALVRRNGRVADIEARAVAVARAEPLVREIEDFVGAAAGLWGPRVDGAAGRRALETALRIREAIEG